MAKIKRDGAKDAAGKVLLQEEQTRLRVATEEHCARWCELLPALRVRFRLLGLLGLLFVAFGPSYSWLLLHLLYGEAWSSTEAPDALAAYCVYVLLMAINGDHSITLAHRLHTARRLMICFVASQVWRRRFVTLLPVARSFRLLRQPD